MTRAKARAKARAGLDARPVSGIEDSPSWDVFRVSDPDDLAILRVFGIA